MANTTNFGWETPDDTDLVKDGAAAMRTLGNSIDASFVDLKGGTTGQVLAKASNTDLDFTWSSVDPLTILDAKGDLITATAADTPARLAVGTNGQVLAANSSTATGLEWQTISGGGMTSLATGSLSGASVTLSGISSSYLNLRLVIRNYKPATDGTFLKLRLNGVSTATYYYVDQNSVGNSGFVDTAIGFGAAGADNTTANGLHIIDIYDYTNTSTWKIVEGISVTNNATTATNFNYERSTGLHNQTAAISSITLLNNSGNFTSGDYILYGVK